MSIDLSYSSVADAGYNPVTAITEAAFNKRNNVKYSKLKKKEFNLLLVDDDREDALYIEELLEEAFGKDIDFEIDTSPSFIDAKQKLENSNYDLAIFDFMLGYQDGIELYKGVKKDKPNMPVVFVTGQGDERTAVSAIKSGAADYLVKDDLNVQLIKQVFSKFIKVTNETPLVKSMRKFISSSKELDNFKLVRSVDKLAKFEPKKLFMKSQAFKFAGGGLGVFVYLDKLLRVW